jgi:hypothetical protein
MPPAASLFNLPVVPTSAQAALAIVILRDKPHNLTVRGQCYHFSTQCTSKLMSAEYVLQLREHYKPGRPAHSEEEQSHYLDLVGYWQEQCQKTQEECDRLRSINIRLERSNGDVATSSCSIANTVV